MLLIWVSADVNLQDDKGRTPLHYAAYGWNVLIVKLLLENGADAEIKDMNDETALDIANNGGDEEVINLLKNHQKEEGYQNWIWRTFKDYL